ncbi:MAG: NrsF family protein [Acidobacteriota bacterium]
MRRPDGRDALIAALRSELTPTRRRVSPTVATAAWLSVTALIGAMAVLGFGPLRAGWSDDLRNVPGVGLEMLAGVLTVLFVGGAVLRLSVPGVPVARTLTLAVLATCAWLGLLVVALLAETPRSTWGLRPFCWAETFLSGLPGLVLGMLLLRRRAPLHRGLCGFLTGFGAAAVPAVLMHLACIAEPGHVLVEHLVPAGLLGLVGAGVGRLVLRKV